MLLLLLGLGIAFSVVHTCMNINFMNNCMLEAGRDADDSNSRD